MELFYDILVHIIIPGLVLFYLTISAILLINRAHYEVHKWRVKKAQTKIDVFLTALIFTPFEEEAYKTAISRFKHRIPFGDRWCKEIILHEIISLKQNLKGEIAKNIHFLYEEFGLLHFSLHLLKDRRWYIKSSGLYHFQALEYEKAEKYIRPYLNSKNNMLSANAYMALVAISPRNLDFLARFRSPITLTNEIKIMDIIHTKKIPMPSNLGDWIKSQNPSIVKLGVRLFVHYNYNKQPAELVSLLNSANEFIRREVVIAARDLFIDNAERTLIAHFAGETKTNKIEIIKTLGTIGNHPSELFFGNLLTQPYRSEIKLEAVESLYKLNPDFADTLAEDPLIDKMIKHVKDLNL